MNPIDHVRDPRIFLVLRTITHEKPLQPPTTSFPQEVGTMTFASGTQKLGYMNKQAISDESHKTLGQFIEAKQFPTVNYGAMSAGDATFHSGWTMHCAPGNPTENMRKVMTVIYVADGTGTAEPDSKAWENDLRGWLPGCKPSDLAASPLNPLVYSK